jgi:hypothetical protein
VTDESVVPDALRYWFVLHFAVDMIVAIPLFVAPELTLGQFGWEVIDPVMTRTVAAALFGIGIESLLCRNKGVEVFRSMLKLKVIWSFAAVVGGSGAIATGTMPGLGWLFTVTFLVFHGLWLYWLVRLGWSA